MAQISVTLVRADTNQEFDVELPDNAPIFPVGAIWAHWTWSWGW